MLQLTDIENLQQFDNFEFLAHQIVEGFITGLHRSPYHGFSVEFAEHRAYNKGESIKHIDWRLFARTEKLFVKRYEEETNLRCQIVIDTSSSMLFPYPESKITNKLGFSALTAASLIHMLTKQRDAAGLSLFDESIYLHTPSKLARTHVQMLYNELGNMLSKHAEKDSLNKKNNLPEILHQLAETIHTRSLVIIFSDMIDLHDPENIFAALQHLKYNKHEVLLFHVTDDLKEQKLAFSNRPTKFIDLETGETLKLNPNEIRDSYSNAVGEYFSALKAKCLQYKIDVIEADINKGFKDVLLAYLIKRNRLY